MEKRYEENYTENNEISLENLNNAKNFEYAVKMTRWLLRPLGLWPIKSSSLLGQFLHWFLIGVSTFLQAFLLVPCCLHMFLIEKDLGVRLKMIGPLSFCLMNIFKYYAVLMKDRQISWCIHNIAIDWHEIGEVSSRKVMLDNAKTARLFTTISALFMYGGGLPYSTILPLTREAILVENSSFHHLAYPSYFVFFNPHVRPLYDLVFVTHCLCSFVMYSVTVGVVSVAITCIMHICSQCSITSSTLKNFAADFDDKRCSEIVRQHLKSLRSNLDDLRFASKLEDILNEMCLVEFLGCTFNMCMLGYYFLTEFENSETLGTITYLLLLASFMFNIFIFCYIGDLLTEMCQSIGQVAYMINWYQLTASKARNIILIIESTQRPVVLTAGKMVTLSIGSFCNVLKASATYLNMLRTLIANNH